MPKIPYRDINFRPATLQVIQQANDIAETNLRQGFSLTLRQLYYRFVAKGLLENTQQNYKRLATLKAVRDNYEGITEWLDGQGLLPEPIIEDDDDESSD